MGFTHEQFLAILDESSHDRWKRPVLEPPPSRAVITIVHDEAFYFPIWLRYYSRFFAPDDIFVLDHDTTDGSTDGSGFQRLPISRDGWDHEWMLEKVQTLQHELIERYDVVLFAEVDEIVAPDPALGDLGDFIDRFDDPYVQCTGRELIHRPELEPPLDPTRPILEQRHWWFANEVYNKPLLATEPLNWVPGFHGLVVNGVVLDTTLHLIHLHRLDFDLCRKRHLERSARLWTEEDLRRGFGAHYRLEDDRFAQWFSTETGMRFPLVMEPIPERWRGVL